MLIWIEEGILSRVLQSGFGLMPTFRLLWAVYVTLYRVLVFSIQITMNCFIFHLLEHEDWCSRLNFDDVCFFLVFFF